MTALATNQRSAGSVSTNHSSPRLALAHAAAHPRHQPPELGQADQTVSVAVKQLERLRVKTENTVFTRPYLKKLFILQKNRLQKLGATFKQL